jgi:cell division protease FtsH
LADTDLQRASDTARDMVIKYGMSDVVGPVYLSSNQELLLGKEIGHTKSYSEELAAQIDEEVKRILEEAMTKAEKILSEHVDMLHKIAAVLIERERIDGDEFTTLWNGGELPPMEAAKTETEQPKNPEGTEGQSAPQGSDHTGGYDKDGSV